MARAMFLVFAASAFAHVAAAQVPDNRPWIGNRAPHVEDVGRSPGYLCTKIPTQTESPLDHAQLPSAALKVMTPALAQAAGLLSMVQPAQRPWVHDIAVAQLQAANKWTQDAQDGLFDYLVRQADEVRGKVDTARSIFGGVTGGLGGFLLGRHVDDMTAKEVDGKVQEKWSATGNGAMHGAQLGKKAAGAEMPTAFKIRDDRTSTASVISVIVKSPCDRSAGDALRALREP